MKTMNGPISKKRVRDLAELLDFRYLKRGTLTPPNNFKDLNLPARGYSLNLSWELLCALSIVCEFEELPLFKGNMVEAFLYIEGAVHEAIRRM